MGDLLTAAAQITCTHGGTVQAVTSQSRALAASQPILTAADSFIVAGCPFFIGPLASPCITINWIVPDTATTASGSPTLSTNSVGLCIAATGAVQGPAIISSTQSEATSI